MSEKKQPFDSYKVFKANYKKWEKTKQKDYIILKTQEEIKEEYNENWDTSILLGQLKKVEHKIKWSLHFQTTLVISIISSFISFCITFMVSNKQNWLLDFDIIVVLLTIIILTAMLVILAYVYISLGEKVVEAGNCHKIYGTYSMFILPYEKFTIIKKLEEKHGFYVENFEEDKSAIRS